MSANLVLFVGLALVAIASALGMLLSRQPVYSALFLILNFCTVAVFYLTLRAPFIAIAQVTVYAGAIMVLFLFVIMLLGGQPLPSMPELRWQRVAAIGLGALLLVEAGYVMFARGGDLPRAETLSAGFGSPAAIGNLLFNRYLLPFEVTSILLLAAMIGAVVLTKSEKKK